MIDDEDRRKVSVIPAGACKAEDGHMATMNDRQVL